MLIPTTLLVASAVTAPAGFSLLTEEEAPDATVLVGDTVKGVDFFTSGFGEPHNIRFADGDGLVSRLKQVLGPPISLPRRGGKADTVWMFEYGKKRRGFGLFVVSPNRIVVRAWGMHTGGMTARLEPEVEERVEAWIKELVTRSPKNKGRAR